MKRPVATEQAPPAHPPKTAPSPRDADLETAPLGDIRSTTPYLPLQGALRRMASVAALVVLDLVGLVLGVYAALTLRAFVYGNDVSQWGLRWRVETDWLPFLTVITVLVFWRAGLYAERERRAGIRPHPGFARPRRRDHADLHDRHGPQLPDVRARADRGPDERGLHRPPARELRRDHGRPAQVRRASGGARSSSARARASRVSAAPSERAAAGSTTSSSARSRPRRTARACVRSGRPRRCRPCSRRTRSTS